MSSPTAATRAAAARSRRRRPAPASAPKDPCPSCGAELGHAHGASRRLVVFTSDRGRFDWQCPDCRCGWTERTSAGVDPSTRSQVPDLG